MTFFDFLITRITFVIKIKMNLFEITLASAGVIFYMY